MKRMKDVIGNRAVREKSRSFTKKGPGRMPYHKGNPKPKTKEGNR